MKIETYIKKNYSKLPKSSFNEIEVVIVQIIKDEDEGWGNHSFEAIGINEKGQILWCYSSGCSYTGDCNAEIKKDIKTFYADFDLSKLDYKKIDFKDLERHFENYG
jgi:hypothetical protein